MKISSLIVWLLLTGASIASEFKGPHVYVAGPIEKPGPYLITSKTESIADLINRVGIRITRSDHARFREGKPLADVKIRLLRNGKMRSFEIDPNSDELWNLQIQANDSVFISREPFGGVYFSIDLKLMKRAPESDSEGGNNPQPEAEGRSR